MHRLETMVDTIVCWYVPGNHQKPTLLNGGARSGFRPSVACVCKDPCNPQVGRSFNHDLVGVGFGEQKIKF